MFLYDNSISNSLWLAQELILIEILMCIPSSQEMKVNISTPPEGNRFVNLNNVIKLHYLSKNLLTNGFRGV